MRTIQEIKDSMTSAFMANEDAAKLWGFTVGTPWNEVMGRVSVENVLLWVVAVCCHVVEGLMDAHKREVDDMLSARLPHGLRWYREKALMFMKDKELKMDSDEYDTSGMSEADVAECRVVKYAAVEEDAQTGILILKVAGEAGDGTRQRLGEEEEMMLRNYMNEVKDAGVLINIINREADVFGCEVDVYYNANLDAEEIRKNVEERIRGYVANLPFNGEYHDMGLVNELQGVQGVKVVDLKNSWSGIDEDSRASIIGLAYPVSGYFKVEGVNINMKPYGKYL